MTEAISALIAAAMVYCAALCAGLTLVRALQLDLAPEEERFFGFLSGAALLSLVVFALAALHLAYTAVYAALAAACVAVFFWRGRGGLRRSLGPVPTIWRLLFWACYGAYFYYYFPNALAPETSPDGVTYHVGLIARYFQLHSYQWSTTNMYADFPQGVEMLFLFAYSLAKGFGRASAAALVHFSFLASLPFGMIAYGRRFGKAAAGVAGALLFFVTPVVGKAGTSAYNDVALAAILFGMLYALEIWASEKQTEMLVLAGGLAGFAYSVKYTAFVALPFALVYVIWCSRPTPRAAIRSALIALGCALIWIVPWAAKDLLVVGNPFAPFLNTYFPNPYFHVAEELQYRYYMAHLNSLTFPQIPMESFRGFRLGGLAGLLLLASPVALLAMRNARGQALLAAAAVFASTYFTNLGIRFLIPSMVFFALALGVALSWRGIAAVLVVAQAILSWPAILPLYAAPYAWKIDNAPWRTAFLRTGEIDYLAKNIGDAFDIARLIEAKTPAEEPIFEMSDTLPRAYMARDVNAAYLSGWGRNMASVIEAAEYEDALPVFVYRYKFPLRRVGRVRLRQTGASTRDLWTINELRFFRTGTEVSRQPTWLLHAAPNPWDVALAFDGNPTTRWSSWEYLHPGMAIDVDFVARQEIDEIRLLRPSSKDEGQALVEEWNGSRWITIPAAVERVRTPIPPRLRKAAEEYLKQNGVRWLVADRSSWAFEDLLKNRVQWDMTAVAHTRDHVLYRLN